jgi:capsular exopolysaccharide synthesis family protein
MNDPTIPMAPAPGPQGRWLDSYMPDGQVVPYQQQPATINFATVRGILFRQRWLIAGVLVAAIIGGVIWTLLSTPMYEATAKVKVEPYGRYIVEGQDVDQGIAASQIYDYISTQIEVLKSRNLADIVAKQANLGARYDLLGEDIDEGRPPNLTDAQWLAEKEKIAAGILAASVSPKMPTENWVIPIGFQSSNRVLAAEMANAYADAFVALESRETVSENSYAVTYLREQIDLTRDRLQQAEEAANLYARNAGIVVDQSVAVEGGSTVTLTSANLSGINQRVAEARAVRIAAEQRWRSLQNLPAAQIPEVQGSPVLQSLISERTRKRVELADLRQRYNDDFPQIRNLLAQLEVLDGQIERSSAEIKSQVRNEYVIARNQEQALEAELASVTGDTLVEQDSRVQYGVLEREAQALRDQLKVLLDRFNQVNSAATVQSGAISKLDSATVPSAPYAPNPLQNMTLALVFGIALAAGLAVLRETLDDRVRSVEEVEDKIGLPLLGFTPHVQEPDLDDAGNNRFSALMEAYGSIRASIDFSLPRSKNVLLLTSSSSSEGKSTTSVILAELFASMGRKTLLIDADLRRPSVSRLVNIERPKVGVVEVLLGHVPLEAAVIKGAHENLEILPVGEIPPNPTEIIDSPEFRAFLQKCREEYSLVILDSSPVMGLADAPILSRMADGTVFILEANRVPFGQARTAVRRIKASGGNILGVVLTKYRALEAGDSYSYQYGYYQYGRDAEQA